MLDQEGRNFYEILGVGQGASTDEIAQAYRQRVQADELLSSRDAEQDADLPHLIEAITEAYQTLSSAEKRQHYDALLSANTLNQASVGTQVVEDPSITFDSIPPSSSLNLEVTNWVPVARRIRTSANLVYDLAQAISPGKIDIIPEEWKREREFFEEHFEEIFKPLPKIDLVGAKGTHMGVDGSAIGLDDWEGMHATGLAATRFGTLPRANERLVPRTIPLARRQTFQRPLRDPFHVLMYLAMPIVAVLVALEIYFYNR